MDFVKFKIDQSFLVFYIDIEEVCVVAGDSGNDVAMFAGESVVG